MRLFIIFYMILFSISMSAEIIKPKLSDYKKNIYSQFGEDGIIEKIFEIIGTTSKVVIEFGAADGFSCSNTANLWTKNNGWKGILIEADVNLFNKVVANVAAYNCIKLNKKVGIHLTDSLEEILKQENINDPIDLLSIDIDGNDYYIFQSLKQLRPRIIICEYNVSIPAYLDVYPDYNNHIGCSVAALQRIAKEKNYTLVSITEGNCIFIVNEELPKFSVYDIHPEHMHINKYVSYIINDYKSDYKVINSKNHIDAWGWSGRQSMQNLNGDLKNIDAQINKK